MRKSIPFGAVMSGYAVIAVAANFTLDHEMLWAVWLLMGGLALKTLVAAQQLRAKHTAEATERGGADKVDPHEEHDRNG